MESQGDAEKSYDFPEDVMDAILSKLPKRSLTRAAVLSKEWNSKVQKEYFKKKIPKPFNFIHHPSDDRGVVSYIKFRLHAPTRRGNFHTPVDPTTYKLIGSFNGLMCFCRTKDLFIFNLITGEYKVISHNMIDLEIAFGYGYLAETNEYKIIRISRPHNAFDIFVHIYTLGKGDGWRYTGAFNLELRFETTEKTGVFWGNRLHWRNIEDRRVVVFDLHTELFLSHYPSPPAFEDYPGFTNQHFTKSFLGVSIQGELYYAMYHDIEGERWYSIWLWDTTNPEDYVFRRKHIPLEVYSNINHSKVAELMKPSQRATSLIPQDQDLDQDFLCIPFGFGPDGRSLFHRLGTLIYFDNEDEKYHLFRDTNGMVKEHYPYDYKLETSMAELGEANTQFYDFDRQTLDVLGL